MLNFFYGSIFFFFSKTLLFIQKYLIYKKKMFFLGFLEVNPKNPINIKTLYKPKGSLSALLSSQAFSPSRLHSQLTAEREREREEGEKNHRLVAESLLFDHSVPPADLRSETNLQPCSAPLTVSLIPRFVAS